MAISIGIGNYISRGLIRGGGIKPIFPEGLIARYVCYDKTNEDEDRNVLKDLSGNGHDIQLYNFAFSKNSGYGSYHLDYTTATSSLVSTGVQKGVARNVTPTSFEFMPQKIDNSGNIGFGVYIGTGGNLTIKLECANIDDGNPVYIVPYNRTVEQQGVKIKLQNGINDVSIIYSDASYPFFTIVSENNTYTSFITFKTIPEYKGALVSDGVDDYGLCENFPILDRDRGYTVCSIRKWISYSQVESDGFVSKDYLVGKGEFLFEYGSKIRASTSRNFGAVFDIKEEATLFSYMNSIKFNGVIAVKGIAEGPFKNELRIFKSRENSVCSNIALYALEIYDRDLTDEEIEKVKARMIAEYEAKTGEKYVES